MEAIKEEKEHNFNAYGKNFMKTRALNNLKRKIAKKSIINIGDEVQDQLIYGSSDNYFRDIVKDFDTKNDRHNIYSFNRYKNFDFNNF